MVERDGEVVKVHVGPVALPELEAAVVAGGAELSSAADASALVWYGGPPEQFAELDHPGLEWVQLPSAGIEPWVASGALRDGVTFTSAAGTYAQTVAEHALAGLLRGALEVGEDVAVLGALLGAQREARGHERERGRHRGPRVHAREQVVDHRVLLADLLPQLHAFPGGDERRQRGRRGCGKTRRDSA